MTRHGFRTAILAVALATAALPLHAQTQTYRAGSTPTGVPFTFLDTKTNSIQGVVVDLVGEIAKDQKVKIEVQGMPFSTLIPSLTSNKIDIIAAALGMTPARREVVDFTEPVYSYGEAMVVNDKDTGRYESLDALKGEVVGVQVGTVYVEPMKKTGLFKEVKVYDSLADVIRDVGLGRIKAGFGDFPIVAYQISQGVHKNVRLVKDHKPTVTVSIGMAVRKGDKATLDMLNTSLAKLKSDGRYDAALTKWGLK
jgi:polar amino acid transport system substrate-binding protein